MIQPRAASAAFLLPAMLALAACGGGDGAEESAGGTQVLRVGNTAEPLSLDPHLTQGIWESAIISDMIVGLYTDDGAGEPIPGMAATTSVSEDGLTWTFTLRDAVWSDGVPVTANDFVYAFRRIMNPETLSQYAALLYGVRNAEEVNTGAVPPEQLGVSAPDDKTLVIELEYPAPYLPSLLTHQTTAPVPSHVVEEFGNGWIQPENIVVNGPYVLEEWRSNNYVRLVKNPSFYEADQVCFQEVYYYPTTDVNAAVRRVRAGELDINTDFPGQQKEELERELPGYVHQHPFLLTTYYVFNQRIAPFDDARVRQALTMTVDREFIVDAILRTGQEPTSRLVPPGVTDYPGGPEADWWTLSREERLERARALLMEAGFGPNNPLSFEFTYRNTRDNPRIAPVVQSNWQDIADWVDVSISGIEAQIHYENLRTGNFQVGDAGWVADYNDAQNFLFLLESRTGAMNYGKYSNPEYDALVARSNEELDPAARTALLVQAENMMLADMPILPMYFDTSRNLVDPTLTGWVDNVGDKHPSRYLCRAPAETADPAEQ
jgi:oligopeptide transport system substrate-binding protein